MTRLTTMSLLAAIAFGVVMAVATSASGEVNQGGGSRSLSFHCPTQTQAACVARCAPRGSSPEQQARCRAQCGYPQDPPADPLDCQYLRQSQTASQTNTTQGLVARHDN